MSHPGDCDVEGFSDVDPLGKPYAFTQTPSSQHTPSYPSPCHKPDVT